MQFQLVRLLSSPPTANGLPMHPPKQYIIWYICSMQYMYLFIPRYCNCIIIDIYIAYHVSLAIMDLRVTSTSTSSSIRALQAAVKQAALALAPAPARQHAALSSCLALALALSASSKKTQRKKAAAYRHATPRHNTHGPGPPF